MGGVSNVMRLSLFLYSLELLRLCSGDRQLPNPVIGGYANWGECGSEVISRVEEGVNLVFWFSINLSPTSPPSGGPNLDCVANISLTLRARGLPTTHMISVGGWDAPHPVGGTPTQFFNSWKNWNENTVSRPGFEGGFDGIDWDLEGNDDVASPWNYLSKETLDIVGGMSSLAKAAGYLVTLVPCESYFDVSTSGFSRNLSLTYPDWHTDFNYHGRNPYSYLWSRYPLAFDAVTIQLYESFSHAGYNISILEQRPADYLQLWVRQLALGYWVNFSSDPALGYESAMVSLPSPQLIIGLANGWAGGTGGGGPKSLLIMPQEVAVAFTSLETSGFPLPRGVAFWCISEEGRVPLGQGTPLFMASALNSFLHTRNTTRETKVF